MSNERKGNPFLPENFLKGGGLWDGKTVTVTKAFTEIHKLAYADGSPVTGNDGKQSQFTCLSIVGITEDSESERKEQYKAGSLQPNADGTGFIDPKTGGPGYWHESSEMAHFAGALYAAGFPVEKLFDEKTQTYDVRPLVGAKLLMKGSARIGKDGKVKVSKKGFEEQSFLPIEFKGFVAGAGSSAAPTPANGGAVAELAEETIVGVLAEAGAKVSRSDLLKKVGAALHGNPDANKVIALIAKDDFHKDKPWTRDGTGYVLA